MKAVLLSIRPKWCELIASGKKTIEVRKTRPKIPVPFKGYIYCTKPKMITKYVFKPEDYPEYMRPEKTVFCKVPDASSPFCSEVNGNGKVIGEFVCKNMTCIQAGIDNQGEKHLYNTAFIQNRMCLNDEELFNYIYDGKRNEGWGWHISDLKIYDKPKELSEFAVADKEAIRQCEYREQSYYSFTDTGYIKNGFYCKVKDDWCFGGCKRKALTRPPQSWCYVEELQNGGSINEKDV